MIRTGTINTMKPENMVIKRIVFKDGTFTYQKQLQE